jgi:hypothetical protein
MKQTFADGGTKSGRAPLTGWRQLVLVWQPEPTARATRLVPQANPDAEDAATKAAIEIEYPTQYEGSLGTDSIYRRTNFSY